MWLKNPRDPNDKVENVAFTAYAAHNEELDNIVDTIVDKIHQGIIFGNTSITFDVDDNISDEDLAYIEQEVQRRL